MEQWRVIEQFPMYDVSSHGHIMNNRTGRELRLAQNQRDIVYVGLMHAAVQYKRSVALLVAAAFLPSPIHVSFDSVIHLDGDRRNCCVENLMYRPHHFVFNFMRQMRETRPLVMSRLYCPETDETFRDSRHLASTYGFLERDILYAMVNEQMIWPTKFHVQELF